MRMASPPPLAILSQLASKASMVCTASFHCAAAVSDESAAAMAGCGVVVRTMSDAAAVTKGVCRSKALRLWLATVAEASFVECRAKGETFQALTVVKVNTKRTNFVGKKEEEEEEEAAIMLIIMIVEK